MKVSIGGKNLFSLSAGNGISKIVKVKIRAAQIVSNPERKFCNFRPSVELEVEIGEEDDYRQVVNSAQRAAEELLKDHFKIIEDVHRVSGVHSRSHYESYDD